MEVDPPVKDETTEDKIEEENMDIDESGKNLLINTKINGII